MSNLVRKREEELERQDKIFRQALSSYKKTDNFIDSKNVLTESMRLLNVYWVRPLDDWAFKGKSNKIATQQYQLLRHLFARYRVPRFLETTMLAPIDNRDTMFAEWYVAVAQGESLYKTCTKGYMSKKETHLFLKAPDHLLAREAITWAKAYAESDNLGIANKVAKTKLGQRDTHKKFWKDVCSFFTRHNDWTVNECDDMIDFIQGAVNENPDWTINKRTLDSVKRKSHEWHRDLFKLKQIGGGAWIGLGIKSQSYTTGKKHINSSKSSYRYWTISEILTGNDLAIEGRRMHHCVSSYKYQCVEGNCAIFTLKSENEIGVKKHCLTIEVDPNSRTIRQMRGYANRMSYSVEDNVVSNWATKNYLRF